MRCFLRMLASVFLWWWNQPPKEEPPKEEPPKEEPPARSPQVDTACCNDTIHSTTVAELTGLTPCLAGMEQRADGSWWLVFATPRGTGLPDGVRLVPWQAERVLRLLRDVKTTT